MMTTLYPFTLYPIRPDILPTETRHVEVAGRVLPVSITQEDGGILASHVDTGCWGYGPDVETAMADCQQMLVEERRWYCEGAGKSLYLYGRAYLRRAIIQAFFAEGT